MKPHYVTTPIFYVNAAPHIGHLHSLLLTDVLSRYSQLRNPTQEHIFATGTDEHGLKIQQVARNQNRDPKELCDDISQHFRALAKKVEASNTHFIRTTDPEHAVAVQYLWRTLQDRGCIYKGTHSGWYAVSDECFYTENQIEDRADEKTGEVRKVAIESGSIVEWTEEENYKFKLSEFRDHLIEWYERNPTAVHPPSLQAQLLKELRAEPLADLSVSRPRSRLSWGIPVPGDEEHTIYVWVDALTNYLTVLGYPWKTQTSQGGTEKIGEGQSELGLEAGWPANVQVVGKDIVRFHAIYWPALLIAAGLPPPKQVLVHAHWTMGKLKMSKSRGNVADPFEVMDRYGVESVRWYLMRSGGALSVDADYSPVQLETHYRILASQLGNLVSRISSPKLLSRALVAFDNDEIRKSLSAPTPTSTKVTSLEQDQAADLMALIDGLKTGIESRLDNFEITRLCEEVMDVVAEANKLFTATEPWSKSCPESTLLRTLFATHESLRLVGIALGPIMPNKMSDMLDRLGVERGQERTWETTKRSGWSWLGDSGVADGTDAQQGVERIVARIKDMKDAGKRKEVLFPPIIGEGDSTET